MRLTLSVAPPFRLDRTVAVLQRLPGNPVDLWTGDAYVRAFATSAGPVIWRVSDAGAGRLSLALDGPAGHPGPWRATLLPALHAPDVARGRAGLARRPARGAHPSARIAAPTPTKWHAAAATTHRWKISWKPNTAGNGSGRRSA